MPSRIVGPVRSRPARTWVRIFRPRARNNHFFTGPEVLLRLGSLGEQCRGLDHDIRANMAQLISAGSFTLKTDGLSLDDVIVVVGCA